MTLAQLILLSRYERKVQRNAEKPAAQPATMMDAAMLARAAHVAPMG